MARKYRFFTRHLVGESMPQNGERPFHLTETLEPEIFFQLIKVLRAAPGDTITLLPVTQMNVGREQPCFEYDYIIETAQKKEIVLRFSKKRANENELNFNLGLILCVPNKPDKLELILQKAVELGASDITLVEGDFSQIRHNLRADRLEKIIIEAAEQSERAIVPAMTMAGKLGKYLGGLTVEERGTILVAMERMEDRKGESLAELLKKKSARADSGGRPENGKKLQILVGPEGGFSEVEKSLIKELNLHCFSLGKRILRMETAAILALGLASLAKN